MSGAGPSCAITPRGAGTSPASTAPPWGTAGVWMSRSSGDRKWGKNRGLAFNTSTAEVLFHPGSSMPCMAWALCFLWQQQQAGHTAAIPHSLPTPAIRTGQVSSLSPGNCVLLGRERQTTAPDLLRLCPSSPAQAAKGWWFGQAGCCVLDCICPTAPANCIKNLVLG